MLGEFDVDNLITQLKRIELSISALNEVVSNNFLSFTSEIRNYNKQIKLVSENAQTTTASIKEMGDKYLELLSVLNQKVSHIKHSCQKKVIDKNQDIKNTLHKVTDLYELIETSKISIRRLIIEKNGADSELENELHDLQEKLLGVALMLKNVRNVYQRTKKKCTPAIEKLALQLSSSLKIFSEEHQRAIDEIPDLEKKSSSCFDSLNKLIIDAQFHDIISQKITHVQDIVSNLIDEFCLIEADDVDGADIPMYNYAGIMPQLPLLMNSQLSFINKECNNALSDAKQTLKGITATTTEMSVFSYDFYKYLLYSKEELFEQLKDQTNSSASKINDAIVAFTNAISADDFSYLFEHISPFEANINEVISRISEAQEEELVLSKKETTKLVTILSDSIPLAIKLLQQIEDEGRIWTKKINSVVDNGAINPQIQKLSDSVVSFINPNYEVHESEEEIENNQFSAQVSANINNFVSSVAQFKQFEDQLAEISNLFKGTLKSMNGSVTANISVDRFKVIEKHYTMDSERELHKCFLSSIQTSGVTHDMIDKIDSFSESGDVEFF